MNKIKEIHLLYATLALNFILLSFISTSKTNLIAMNANEFDINSLKSEVCTKGIKSILNREANLNFVNPELVESLKNSDYEGVGDQSLKSLSTKMSGNLICRAIANFKNSKRSFQVEIHKNNDHPFFFKVLNIRELTRSY